MKKIYSTITGQIHTIFFLTGIVMLEVGFFKLSNILGLITLGVSLIIISKLIDSGRGGE